MRDPASLCHEVHLLLLALQLSTHPPDDCTIQTEHIYQLNLLIPQPQLLHCRYPHKKVCIDLYHVWTGFFERCFTEVGRTGFSYICTRSYDVEFDKIDGFKASCVVLVIETTSRLTFTLRVVNKIG